MSNKKVIIIGAGIGGLASAVRLLKKGYEVKIFEKNSNVGGVVNQFSKLGYTFDLTASLTLMPQDLLHLFNDLNLRNELEIIPSSELYRVFNYDGRNVDFNLNLGELMKTLETFSVEDSTGYLKLISELYEKYHVTRETFLTQSFEDRHDFFNIGILKNMIKINPFKTTEAYVSTFINNEYIKNYLYFQAMYIGSSPYDSSDAYALLPGVTQFYGLPYFKGGMYSFVKQLETLILKMGGTIRCNEEVTELVTDAKVVKGVKVGGAFEEADIVLVNGNLFEMKAKLLENDEKLSCSVFMLYLGIKKELPNLSLHNIYIGDKFKENIEAVFKGSLPDKPSVYIYCPSHLDASMAPKGCECLNIMVRVPNLTSKIVWSNEVIQMLKEKIYVILEEILGCEKIEHYIEVEEVLTPQDLEERFGLVKGAAFGLGHHLFQTNYFRPHYHSQMYQNLYYVGASNHPGTGISLVLNGARLVVDEIDKHI